ncbi:glycosyltransferase [Sphingomonas sp. MMS12-HWE2-04]|uniref:glycosyltransferase n=1 Tax=Sphingomonas sp. MMS12-HWE2-04 TaxID=3234199 RepID=UPI00384CF75C
MKFDQERPAKPAGGQEAISYAGLPLAIGVPVRNEVQRLPRLLDALRAQHGAPCFSLCLFFDGCTDGSAELVASLAPGLPFPVITEACADAASPNAGRARARAMRLAMAAAPAGLILTTDADSAPDSHWVAANCAALAEADIVAGRITRDATADHQHHVSRYFDRLHGLRRSLDPVPWEDMHSHHWGSGASLGFRAPVYRALGGFPELPSGEDAAMIDAAMRGGYRVRRDARVEVRTSSRRDGRAPVGFATALAHFDAADRLPEVTHPDDDAWRFAMQAEARAAFERDDVRSLAPTLRLCEDELLRTAAASVNGEAFAARIVGAPPNGMRLVSLDHAEALLAARAPAFLAGAA